MYEDLPTILLQQRHEGEVENAIILARTAKDEGRMRRFAHEDARLRSSKHDYQPTKVRRANLEQRRFTHEARRGEVMMRIFAPEDAKGEVTMRRFAHDARGAKCVARWANWY